MIQVFDNFISQFYKEDLQAAIFGSELAWVRHEETAGGYNGNYSWISDKNTEESNLFVMKPSKDDSEIISFVPLTYRIQEVLGYRIYVNRLKINLMLPGVKNNPNSYNRPHVDHSYSYAKTLLYYVNDSDGDTFFFDQTYTGSNPGDLKVVDRITPKAGTAVIFDSYRYHASSTPTADKRSAINIIFWSMGDHLKQSVEGTPFPQLPDLFSDPSDIKNFFTRSK